MITKLKAKYKKILTVFLTILALIIAVVIVVNALTSLVEKEEMLIVKNQSVNLTKTVKTTCDAIVPFGTHPNMFLNQCEIEEIKRKIANNEEPWASEKIKLVNDANSLLRKYADCNSNDNINTKKCESVTYQGNSSNDYFTESPYGGWKNCICAKRSYSGSEISCSGNTICSGKLNLDQDREDYTAAQRIGKTVRTLGLAYTFTGDERYAKKAIELIYIWAVKPETRMTPGRIGDNGHVEVRYFLPPMFYGADLIWNSSNWILDEINVKDGLKSWAGTIAGPFINSNDLWGFPGDVLFGASGAIIAENRTMLDASFTKWKNKMPDMIDTTGKNIVVYRTHGEATFSYAILILSNMIKGAEIARHYEENLYTYTKDGKSLEKSLDFYTPYIIDPYSWPDKQNEPTMAEYIAKGIRSETSPYEVAYSYFKNNSIDKPSYWSVITKWGYGSNYVMYDNSRHMGFITLTHRYRAN